MPGRFPNGLAGSLHNEDKVLTNVNGDVTFITVRNKIVTIHLTFVRII